MRLLDKILSIRLNLRGQRPRTVVYKSIWLHGQYAVTYSSCESVVHDYEHGVFTQQIIDQIVELLPGEPTAAMIHSVRSNPGITIKEVF